MTWEGVVWQIATEANLGHHSFLTRPKPGQLVEIDHEDTSSSSQVKGSVTCAQVMKGEPICKPDPKMLILDG